MPWLHGIYTFAMEARNQHFGLGGARDAVVLVNC